MCAGAVWVLGAPVQGLLCVCVSVCWELSTWRRDMVRTPGDRVRSPVEVLRPGGKEGALVFTRSECASTRLCPSHLARGPCS